MELAEDMFIYYVVTDQGVARAVSLNVRPKGSHSRPNHSPDPSHPYAILPCTTLVITVASLLSMPIRDFDFQMRVTQYVTNP